MTSGDIVPARSASKGYPRKTSCRAANDASLSGEWRDGMSGCFKKCEDGPRNRCVPKWMASTGHKSGLSLTTR